LICEVLLATLRSLARGLWHRVPNYMLSQPRRI